MSALTMVIDGIRIPALPEGWTLEMEHRDRHTRIGLRSAAWGGDGPLRPIALARDAVLEVRVRDQLAARFVSLGGVAVDAITWAMGRALLANEADDHVERAVRTLLRFDGPPADPFAALHVEHRALLCTRAWYLELPGVLDVYGGDGVATLLVEEAWEGVWRAWFGHRDYGAPDLPVGATVVDHA